MKERANVDEPEGERQYIFDNEFSWTWALQGEQPPPSAVVGRRDTVSAATEDCRQPKLIPTPCHPVRSTKAGSLCGSHDGRQDATRRTIALDCYGRHLGA